MVENKKYIIPYSKEYEVKFTNYISEDPKIDDKLILNDPKTKDFLFDFIQHGLMGMHYEDILIGIRDMKDFKYLEIDVEEIDNIKDSLDQYKGIFIIFILPKNGCLDDVKDIQEKYFFIHEDVFSLSQVFLNDDQNTMKLRILFIN
jgi:hypothetical protein